MGDNAAFSVCTAVAIFLQLGQKHPFSIRFVYGKSLLLVLAELRTIDELAGNVASNDDRISIAHVKVGNFVLGLLIFS